MPCGRRGVVEPEVDGWPKEPRAVDEMPVRGIGTVEVVEDDEAGIEVVWKVYWVAPLRPETELPSLKRLEVSILGKAVEVEVEEGLLRDA
jgi:hypothetical protein